jgi:hypothetical protein
LSKLTSLADSQSSLAPFTFHTRKPNLEQMRLPNRDGSCAAGVLCCNRGESVEATPKTGNEAPIEAINHPAHYGGAEDPYEAIKVVEAWGLGFHLGNVVKYLSRAGKKGDALEDLKKARWYLDRQIANLEKAQAKG